MVRVSIYSLSDISLAMVVRALYNTFSNRLFHL